MSGQLVVVLDRLPAHRCAWLQQQLKRYERLHLEYLPPYAPELNPVEWVWKTTRYDGMCNYAPDNLTQLLRRAERELKDVEHDQVRLRSFIGCSHLPLKLDL